MNLKSCTLSQLNYLARYTEYKKRALTELGLRKLENDRQLYNSTTCDKSNTQVDTKECTDGTNEAGMEKALGLRVPIMEINERC